MVTFKQKYYVTTAIAYVNGPPHAGHMLEFIQADFIARYQRAIGKDVHFLTGTDEHGQKIVEAAEKQGLSVQELVDKNAATFQEFTKLLQMSNDDFIRTSDQKRHWPSVIKLWNKLAEKGDIYKKEYEGLYCVGCEKFLTEKELDENGNCPNHQKPPKTIKEENYFFKLSKYAKQVGSLIKEDKIAVFPQTRKNEILSFLDGEVKDISFSRHKKSLSWGIPVPGDSDQVMYVWCDALTNYMSALDYANESTAYKKQWPADVHVIGKDILRFHAAYWPAMHLSAGVPPPKRVFAHGFVNNKGQKMSKSLGNVIDPYEQVKKFGVEPLRLYLLKELPSGDDGDYDESLVVETINNDLANDLGNLIRRVTVLVEKNFQGTIPKPTVFEPREEELIETSSIFQTFDTHMQKFEFHKALEVLWEFVRHTNKYLTDTEPWKIKEKDRLATVLYTALEATRLIAHYLLPAMPDTAANILSQIGQKPTTLKDISFSEKTQGTIAKGDILFKKIETGSDSMQEETTNDQTEKFPLNLKVAKVEQAEDHPNADKLFVLQLDLGDEKRQLVAGLKGHYTVEQLTGKHIVIISNLKYAKLRGKESQGMLLAGDDGDEVGVVTTTAPPGTQVTVEGLENATEQLTFDDFMKIEITVKEGKPTYDGKQFSANGVEVVTEKVRDGARVR